VDEGAVVRLNATIVGGVEYMPAEVVTAWNPGVYKPLFYAVYRTVARDVLGVPNPLATVKLCNATAQAGLDGSAVVAVYTRELCQPAVEALSISPYTAAGAVAVATACRLRAEETEKIIKIFFSFNSPNKYFLTGVFTPVSQHLQAWFIAFL
jgi:hypothetical protein